MKKAMEIMVAQETVPRTILSFARKAEDNIKRLTDKNHLPKYPREEYRYSKQVLWSMAAEQFQEKSHMKKAMEIMVA
nr:hypothetical protein CFP56_77282 [Quercus suber]